MRTCQSCGLENPDDADFCSCGEYLRWEPTSYISAVKPSSAPPAAVGATGAAETAETAEVVEADPAGATAQTAPVPDGPPLDPNVTLAGGPSPQVWGAPAAPGALPVGVRPVPGTPGSGDAPPGAASLTLRLPGDDSASPGAVRLAVEPGQQVTIVGVIRNQSEVVDNFDLWIRGLPQGWSTIMPATAYLVPYGSGGTYEQEMQILITPPRSPEAIARPWPFEVVAESRAYGGEVAAAAASVVVGPYYEVVTELRPQRASGRLKARYRLIVRNRANARTEVLLNAEDANGECKFRFAEPKIALEPGNALECPFTVFPPKQIWLGRSVERPFTVTAAPVAVETPTPPRSASFRQRAWLPWWLAIVVPIVVVLALLAIKLLPHAQPVPSVVGMKSVFAAQQLLNKDGFTVAAKTVAVADTGGKPVGSIAGQSPPAGASAKSGSMVTLEVYAGSGKVKVPSVVGLTVGLADESLRASSLALGTVTPQPVDPARKIVSQLPLAGASVPGGTAIAVFLAIPAGAGTTTSSTVGSTSTSGSGSTTAAVGDSSSSSAAGGSTTTPAGGASTTTSAGAGAATTTSPGGASSTSGSGAAAAGAAGAGAVAAGLAGAAAEAGTGSVKVPPVSGDPVTAASQLSQAGLEPKPLEEVAEVPLGQVAGTIPKAGSSVKKGAVIDLLISSGSPQLSYDNQQTITVINPATRKVSGAVPSGSGPAVEASWSPDGTHVIYSQNGQLVIDQPNNSKASPLQLTKAQTGVSNVNPSFAPTLKSLTIAFIQQSGNSAQLCFATITLSALKPDCTSPPTGWDIGGEADWANSGSQILVLGTNHGGANFGLLEFTSKVPFSTHASDWGHGTLITNASVAGQGVLDGQISPNGKQLALVAGSSSTGFGLYIVPASELHSGQLTFTQQQQLPGVAACQVAWRPDGQQLAVMQPSGPCGPDAVGTLVALNPASPTSNTILATNAAHPAWQPIPGG